MRNAILYLVIRVGCGGALFVLTAYNYANLLGWNWFVTGLVLLALSTDISLKNQGKPKSPEATENQFSLKTYFRHALYVVGLLVVPLYLGTYHMAMVAALMMLFVRLLWGVYGPKPTVYERNGKFYRMTSPPGSYPAHLQAMMRPEAGTWAEWEPVQHVLFLGWRPAKGCLIWASPEEFTLHH